MAGVVWAPAAIADIRRIEDHVAQDNPVAARRLLRELLISGDSLDLFAGRGRPVPQTALRELLVMSPYVILYRVLDDGSVDILRVRHAARRWV